MPQHAYQRQRRWLLIVTHVASVAVFIALIWQYVTGQLGFNPIQELTFRSGEYALILLVLCLACTPLNTVFGLRQLLPLRRWFGLYAFAFACLHLLTFVALDYQFDLVAIGREIIEKRYILVGLTAFLILLPLAITSTRGWMQRLGKQWKRLHRLVYVAALLAVLHYAWVVKSDIRVPLLYGIVILLLLIVRLPRLRKLFNNLRNRQSRIRTQSP